MTTQAHETLSRHPWKLTEIASSGMLQPIPSEFKVTLQFEGESHVHGKSACNRYFGSYHVHASQLRFQPLGVTRMACSEAAMSLENEYLAALGQVETYQLQTDQLTFYDKQGKSVLRYVPGASS